MTEHPALDHGDRDHGERHAVVTARGYAKAYREALITFRKAMGYTFDATDCEVSVDLMAAMWCYEDARDWENDITARDARAIYDNLIAGEREAMQLPDPRNLDTATDSKGD